MCEHARVAVIFDHACSHLFSHIFVASHAFMSSEWEGVATNCEKSTAYESPQSERNLLPFTLCGTHHAERYAHSFLCFPDHGVSSLLFNLFIWSVIRETTKRIALAHWLPINHWWTKFTRFAINDWFSGSQYAERSVSVADLFIRSDTKEKWNDRRFLSFDSSSDAFSFSFYFMGRTARSATLISGHIK